MITFDFNDISKDNGETLLWRFLREGETNDDEFNIWPIMKSKTMREYYKNNIKLSTEAIIEIITNSCISMYDKIKYLNEFKEYCNIRNYDTDKAFIESFIVFYNIVKEIFEDPSTPIYKCNKVIYSLRCSRFMCNDFDQYKWPLNNNLCMFDEYQPCKSESFNNTNDIIKYILQIKDKYDIFYIDAFIINKYDTKLIRTYDIKFINNHICIDTECDFLNGLNSFFIPCNDGDLCTLNIPWIKQEIKGKIRKELSDIWYYHLTTLNSEEPFTEPYIWLTRTRINDCSNRFSIFDFVELE